MDIGKYRFELVPTLFFIFTFCLFIYLGLWQLDRMHQKETLIENMRQRLSQPTSVLPQELFPTEYQFRPVEVRGEYLHNKEIFVYARSGAQGNEDGFLLFTPMLTNDNRIIIINRGWIPSKLKSQANRLDTLEVGATTVKGAVMLSEKKGWAVPENDTINNIWFYIDLKQMQAFLGFDVETQYYIQRAYNRSNLGLPIGQNVNENIHNQHFKYVITWFLLATVLVLFFVFYCRRKDVK